MRLYWVLQNIPAIKQELERNNVMFGTLETWLVYKLTGGKVFVTDATNASATGFFDPFVHEWSAWAVQLFKLPKEIFPPVVNNDHDFGYVEEEFFGCPIPIECVVSIYLNQIKLLRKSRTSTPCASQEKLTFIGIIINSFLFTDIRSKCLNVWFVLFR